MDNSFGSWEHLPLCDSYDCARCLPLQLEIAEHIANRYGLTAFEFRVIFRGDWPVAEQEGQAAAAQQRP